MGTLYTYQVITKCRKFNHGEKIIRTYTKMHDGRTKDKIGNISCAVHMPPCPITLKLMNI